MLSTPTARTRKGITSIIIRVDLKPKRDIKPMEERTEAKTIVTPAKPRQIRESTKSLIEDLNLPSAIAT